jgi:hypothetical protein
VKPPAEIGGANKRKSQLQAQVAAVALSITFGLVAVIMGLVIAGGTVMGRATDTDWRMVAVTIAAAAVTLVTRPIQCGRSLQAARLAASVSFDFL